jgi:hypothetical protein
VQATAKTGAAVTEGNQTIREIRRAHRDISDEKDGRDGKKIDDRR